MAAPVIDLATAVEGAESLIATQLYEVGRTFGYFVLENHGLGLQSIKDLFDDAQEYFSTVPEDAKAQWPISREGIGYSAPLCGPNKDDRASIWLSGPPGFLRTQCSNAAIPPFWQDKLETIESFKGACNSIVVKLVGLLALALEIDRLPYTSRDDERHHDQLRLLHYPARPNRSSCKTHRMSPHSDAGTLTLLMQTCPGVEIRSPSGEWKAVPHVRNQIVVFLGDALAAWSRGRLKATVHRVTFDSVPFATERLSIAYFGAPLQCRSEDSEGHSDIDEGRMKGPLRHSNIYRPSFPTENSSRPKCAQESQWTMQGRRPAHYRECLGRNYLRKC